MFLPPWFQAKLRPAKRIYRLGVEVLEDRTVPTALVRNLPAIPVPGPATHLQVIVPTTVQADVPFTVVVEAEDAHNLVATKYQGVVHFSLGTADSGASVPANFVFTAADAGVHAFTMTLSAAGNETIKVSDTNKKVSGGGALTKVVQTATHFAIIEPTTITQGTPVTVTVEALDAGNHIVTGYTGAVSLLSSDTYATLPADYTFKASDKGSHQFTLTFESYGSQVLSVEDLSNSSTFGSVNVNVAYNPFFIPSFAYQNGWGNPGFIYW